MRFCLGLMIVLLFQPVSAQPLDVVVADPFIELHTGPGRGYPVFHVVERGQRIELLRRRTQWVEVVSPRGQRGWVHRRQLGRTLDDTGDYMALEEYDWDTFSRGHGEVGVMVGETADTTALTVQGGWAFTDRLRLELALSEANNNFATRRLADLSISNTFLPRRRVSPYMIVGTGWQDLRTRTVLVRSDTSSDRSVHAGVGVRVYLLRSFLWRTEYRRYVMLTNRNENEEVNQWRTGFSVLF